MKIGAASLLTIVFIVLKLTGHIDWHWVLVLLPSIIMGGIYTIIVTILFIQYMKTH